MSRVIKFRAWDEELKQMTTVIELFCHGQGNVWGRRFYFKDAILDEPKSERVKLMQFTGLHDKNGKEIWEGDILRTVRYERLDEEINTPIRHLHIVEFKDGGFQPFTTRYNSMSPELFEVLGNIYENKELLNGGGA